MLDLLVASGETEPPVRRLRSPAARPGLEALAGALAAGQSADPGAARTVLAAARAVVFPVLPASGVLSRSRPPSPSRFSLLDGFPGPWVVALLLRSLVLDFYLYIS
jgi:hypothetical protein